MFFGLNAKAKTTADYFAGKWNVIIIGTLNGDSKLTLVFDKKDGKLTGAVRNSSDKEPAKITQIDKSITAAFNVQNYDVTLTLDPVDENNVKEALWVFLMQKAFGLKKTNKF